MDEYEIEEQESDVIITRNKLVLIGKLLKTLKELMTTNNENPSKIVLYKINVQKKMIESLLHDNALDSFIDTLRRKIDKEKLRIEIDENIDEEDLYEDE